MNGNVAMIVFSTYPADPRVRREAEALADAGLRVDVICLRREGEPRRERINGVEVWRQPLGRQRGGGLTYCRQYLAFIMLAFMQVGLLRARRRYDVVHVHNMPDVLVFSALIPKLTGARVILDLHDPMPEVYLAKYGLRPDSPVVRFLAATERWSIRFADLVLTPNLAFQRRFVARGCPAEKIRIVMNAPDPKIFRTSPPLVEPGHALAGEPAPDAGPDAGREAGRAPGPDAGRGKEGLVLMYHGAIVERHGLDTALEALGLLRDRLPGLILHVYGEGDYLDRFLRRVTQLRLGDLVQFHGYAPLERIAQAIAQADLGLIPNKRNVFTEINLPTRIFEYLSLGKPVIAPHTAGIRDYFREDELLYFDADDAESLAATILHAQEHPAEVRRVLGRGEAVLARHGWDIQKERLIAYVAALCQGRTPPLTEPAATLASDGSRPGAP